MDVFEELGIKPLNSDFTGESVADSWCLELVIDSLRSRLEELLLKRFIDKLKPHEVNGFFEGRVNRNGEIIYFLSHIETKIHLCYALGIINYTESGALKIIANLREWFLDNSNVEFEDIECTTRINGMFNVLFWNCEDTEKQKLATAITVPRKRFEFAVAILFASLENHWKETKHLPKAKKSFPPLF